MILFVPGSTQSFSTFTMSPVLKSKPSTNVFRKLTTKWDTLTLTSYASDQQQLKAALNAGADRRAHSLANLEADETHETNETNLDKKQTCF